MISVFITIYYIYTVKQRALHLAKLWGMDLQKAKAWYYRLRREEKIIVKALLRLRKLEMKRKLKKISKQWKIENEDNIDINYLKKEDKKEDELKIAPHFTNIDEYLYFGDDIEFLKHYRRTCSNVMNSLNKFFQSNKQTVQRGITKSYHLSVTDVKMNKSCTVVYAWWDIPLFIDDEVKTEEKEMIYKKIELNLNQSSTYIKGYITREIGLRYAPELRFVRDSFDADVGDFEEYIENIQENELKKKESDVITYGMSKNDIHYLKNTAADYKTLIEQLKSSNNDKTKTQEVIDYFSKNPNISLFDYYKALSNEDVDLFKSHIKILKEYNNIKLDQEFGEPKENLVKEDKKKEVDANAPMTKAQKKMEVKRKKVTIKMKIPEVDLQKSKEMPDLDDAYMNYVAQYSPQIPGVQHFGVSLKKLNERSNVINKRDENIQEEYQKSIKRAAREGKKLNPNQRKRQKSVDFWKSLDNLKA